MMTLTQALQWLPGARLVGDGATPIQRVHTDTRTLQAGDLFVALKGCLLYTSPSPRDRTRSRMPSSA